MNHSLFNWSAVICDRSFLHEVGEVRKTIVCWSFIPSSPHRPIASSPIAHRPIAPFLRASNRNLSPVSRYIFKKRWLTRTLLCLTSAFIVTIAYTALSIYLYGNKTNTAAADAAIVLGAAVWGENPSPVFRERINHGINLYQRHTVQRLIFTGGKGELDEPAEAIVAKRYAIAQGVLPLDIFTETQSRTTRQNLYYASQIVTRYQLKRILIVSDPLHMKRSVLMARDLNIDAYPSPTPTTRYRRLKNQIMFLARETYFYVVYQLLGI